MALSAKDGLWDRNFQSYEQDELNKDSKLEDEIKITWAHLSCLKRRNVDTLIIGNDKSCHLFNVLMKSKFYKLATIDYAKYKVDVTTSQRGMMEPVIVYSNKDPNKVEPSLSQYGPGAILMAQSGQFNDSGINKPEIIFVYAPNVPNNYHYCIAEFISFQFRPKEVIAFDIMSRGNFVQNYDELEMPQLRKVCTSKVYNQIYVMDEEKKDNDADSEDVLKYKKLQFVDNIRYLETGNLITSLSAAILQQCEYNGINGYLFVSVSDLDYLTETLISFGKILIDFMPSLSEILGFKRTKKLQSIVTQKCAKYANKNGHLLTGRTMFC